MSRDDLEEARGMLNAIREMMGYAPLEYPLKVADAEHTRERRKELRDARSGCPDGRTARGERMKHRGVWYDRTQKGAL